MSNATHQTPDIILDAVKQRLLAILSHPGDGIVAMVDGILIICSDYRVQFEFRENAICGQFLGYSTGFEMGGLIPKSVLRALIARIAALCNEQTPNAVSPYGGERILTISAKPGALLKAVFANTTDQQHLTLTTLRTAIEVPIGQEGTHEEMTVESGNLVPLRR